MAEQRSYKSREVSEHRNQTVSSPSRSEQAVKLRTVGCSFRQIAKRLGVTPSTAYGYVRRAITRQRRDLGESHDDRYDLDQKKHAWLERRLMKAAKKGDWQAARLLISSIKTRRSYFPTMYYDQVRNLGYIAAVLANDDDDPEMDEYDSDEDYDEDRDDDTDDDTDDDSLSDEEPDVMESATVEEDPLARDAILRSCEPLTNEQRDVPSGASVEEYMLVAGEILRSRERT